MIIFFYWLKTLCWLSIVTGWTLKYLKYDKAKLIKCNLTFWTSFLTFLLCIIMFDHTDPLSVPEEEQILFSRAPWHVFFPLLKAAHTTFQVPNSCWNFRFRQKTPLLRRAVLPGHKNFGSYSYVFIIHYIFLHALYISLFTIFLTW